MEDRDYDKKYYIVPDKDARAPEITLDVIKSAYIAEGLSPKEIAIRFFISEERVDNIINQYNLPELRKAYIVQGIQKIQNIQLQQSQRLMDIGNNFKKLRILQLEDQLKDFIAYYERHGDFYKRHPTTGIVLKDTNGIPLQLKIPSVTREISELKESVTMSEGVRSLLHRLDEIINTGKKKENINDSDDVIDAQFNELFADAED